MPQHPQRLRLEERVERLAIAAHTAADLADEQGLTGAHDTLVEVWTRALALSSALSQNRQPPLWAIPAEEVRSPVVNLPR